MISPQGYNLGEEPKSKNPFWDGEGEDSDVNRIYATAKITGGTGTPSVQTSKTVDGHDITFGFNFHNIKGRDGTDGTNGTDGQDGVSPTITVTDITGGHRVSITDVTGTHSFNVMNGTDGRDGRDGTNGTNGRDGADGVSPSVSVSDITGGHRITVTDATGSETFDVMNGTDGRDGTNGTNGQDGVSPTITVTDITGGHRVDITDAQGTESFNVMNGTDGRDGTNGTNGQDGTTPDITMSATADATASASPTVTVTKSGTAANPAFALAFSGLKGAPGQDAEWPTGGSVGDVLTKSASGVEWATPSGGGGYTNKVYTYSGPVIPTVKYARDYSTDRAVFAYVEVALTDNFTEGTNRLTNAQAFNLASAGKGYFLLRGQGNNVYFIILSALYTTSTGYAAGGCSMGYEGTTDRSLYFIRTAE